MHLLKSIGNKIWDLIKGTIKRWESLWGILFLLIVIWFSLSIYENWGKEYKEVAFIVIKEFIQLSIFYIGIKIVLGLNSVIGSIGESFKHILLKREFFKTLSREELINIANDITDQDNSIIFTDNIENKLALENTIETWDRESETAGNYIIMESWSNETLYCNNQLIMHRKMRIKMMRNGVFCSSYKYLPFDKDVKENKDEEEFFLNVPGERWEGKAFQYHVLGNQLGRFDCNIETITKTYKEESKEDELWVQFLFETDELEKGQEFEFEFAITDTIDVQNKERMDNYFSYQFDREKHAIRNISFQIETYNDITDPKIRLEPRVYKDGRLIQNRNNCSESLFYKSWKWTIRNLKTEPRKISYKLINPGRNLSQCIEVLDK